jgi:hypothetical protein
MLRAAVTKSELHFGTETKGQTVSSTVAITNVGITNTFFTGAEISGTSSSDFSDDYNDNAPCGNTSASPLLLGKTCQKLRPEQDWNRERQLQGVQQHGWKSADALTDRQRSVTDSNCLHHSAAGALRRRPFSLFVSATVRIKIHTARLAVTNSGISTGVLLTPAIDLSYLYALLPGRPRFGVPDAPFSTEQGYSRDFTVKQSFPFLDGALPCQAH